MTSKSKTAIVAKANRKAREHEKRGGMMAGRARRRARWPDGGIAGWWDGGCRAGV